MATRSTWPARSRSHLGVLLAAVAIAHQRESRLAIARVRRRRVRPNARVLALCALLAALGIFDMQIATAPNPTRSELDPVPELEPDGSTANVSSTPCWPPRRS